MSSSSKRRKLEPGLQPGKYPPAFWPKKKPRGEQDGKELDRLFRPNVRVRFFDKSKRNFS